MSKGSTAITCTRAASCCRSMRFWMPAPPRSDGALVEKKILSCSP